MQSVEAAILRTVLYAYLFRFPLTLPELHHFLIHDTPVDIHTLDTVLRQIEQRTNILQRLDGYILYRGDRALLTRRLERESLTNQLWPLAVQYGTWLARLPFIRMVAITGALSMHNPASATDDLDYIIVTAPRRVWLARAFAIVVVRLARLRGVTVCPNYVLAETAMLQERRDIFLAHEVAQMAPVFGYNIYQRFRSLNRWTDHQLPNAIDPFFPLDENIPTGVWAALKQGLENLLSGQLGNWLENWEHHRKVRRFAVDIRHPHTAAKLDAEQIKGHFNDHGHPILKRYEELLQQHGLHDSWIPDQLAGD
jgi:hypothetical protein